MDKVNHPEHYGGEDNTYEAIKVIEAWGMDKDAYLFNAVKYLSRCGKKDGNQEQDEIKKAIWYLQRKLKRISE